MFLQEQIKDIIINVYYEFDDKEFKEEYKKIYRDAEECAAMITKALNELPVYYRYHINKNSVR